MEDEIVMRHQDDTAARSTITVPKRDRKFWENQGYVLLDKTAPVPMKEED